MVEDITYLLCRNCFVPETFECFHKFELQCPPPNVNHVRAQPGILV